MEKGFVGARETDFIRCRAMKNDPGGRGVPVPGLERNAARRFWIGRKIRSVGFSGKYANRRWLLREMAFPFS
jgi:hypothetical protein